MIRAGTVVQSKVEPYHHFIVLTNPNAAGEVLFVTCSDARHFPFEPVRLHEGDHPFVVKETALVLKRTRRVAATKIASNVPLHFAQRSPLDAAALRRLQAEAKASDRLPPAWIEDLP
ncbi:MAG: hypothetical protein OXE49_07175 [Gemmatimonadetes bacterium]|nr:hypothetical protein [Gemmatimonadota bacterium]